MISGGGRHVRRSRSNTITYSLSVPESLVSGCSFADCYAYLDDWVLGALADMGIKAWYQPLNDIATEPARSRARPRSGSWPGRARCCTT